MSKETRIRAIYAIIHASMRFCFPQVQQAWAVVQPIAHELVNLYDAYFVYRQACAYVKQSGLPEHMETIEKEMATLRVMISQYEHTAQGLRKERESLFMQV